MNRINYQVVHDTIYNYAYQVVNSQQFTHLTPRHTAHQEVLWHLLEFSPAPDENTKSRDYYGNHCHSVLIQSLHDTLHVKATTLVRLTPFDPDNALAAQAWETALVPSIYEAEVLEVADMRLSSPLVPLLEASQQYAARFLTPGRPWLEAMMDLTAHIKQEFTYDAEATDVNTPLTEVLAGKRGVCQDFAHVMLSCLRSHKLAGRYVSGYILNEPPAGEEKMLGSDASHAWVETWLPGLGWVGFDPTNGKLATTEFITIGWGRDYSDVPPLRGVVLGGGEHELEVRVSVTRLNP